MFLKHGIQKNVSNVRTKQQQQYKYLLQGLLKVIIWDVLNFALVT